MALPILDRTPIVRAPLAPAIPPRTTTLPLPQPPAPAPTPAPTTTPLCPPSQVGPGGYCLPQPAWPAPTSGHPSSPPVQNSPLGPTSTSIPTVTAPLIINPPTNGGGQTQLIAGSGATGTIYHPGAQGPTSYGPSSYSAGISFSTTTFPFWIFIVIGIIWLLREL